MEEFKSADKVLVKELTVERPIFGPPMICCPVEGFEDGDIVIVEIRKK